MENEISFERVKELLRKNKFVFAKTMSATPHYYTMKFDWASLKEFNEVVMFIRKYGYTEKFGSKTYMYLDVDGYKYWTMGNTLEITKLINKAVTKTNTPLKKVKEVKKRNDKGTDLFGALFG